MRKIISTILIMTILLSTIGVNASTKKFSDVTDKDWFNNDLTYLLNDSRQIINGYPDGTFKPNDTLTVSQLIKCIVLAANLDVETSNKNEYWAKPYIERAKGMMYVLDGEFSSPSSNPYEAYEKPITRGEMARIVVRAVKDITGLHNYRDLEEIKKLVKDYDQIPKHLQTYVLKSYDIGIITGYPDGTFKAKETLTRAEAVAVIRRAIDISARKSPSLGSVEIIDGIEFDRERDIDPVYKGSMKLDKQEEFVMKFFNSLKFYTDEDGKSYVEGYVPNIPEGFEWYIGIGIFYNDNQRNDMSTDPLSKRINGYMPTGETFKFALKGDGNKVDQVVIDGWIINIENRAEAGRFFLDYPDKKLDKYDKIRRYPLQYNWEEVFGQW